ncbi:threonine/serine exporter family protein [Angelakisella massiliensis]|uniref:threonine/serine exporter family protein n=1 Tax=Angelakisella massiliensis TaxID=1871018 RepID=UPI0008F85207|nr:threonine/serine exporter family protein [Angelakisella massiliensis]
MKQDHSEALEIAVYAGNILLQSGAEIFRVEETIDRITSAYGVESCNSFVLSSGIFTTAGSQREEYFAKVKHIPLSGARLDKVEAVNQLSREISRGEHTLEEARRRLEEIDAMPKKSARSRILASGVGSGCFCLLFGGSLPDCFVSFWAGLLLYCYLYGIENRSLSKITSTIGGSALATLVSVVLFRLGLGANLNQIVIGSIIPLLPGVSFTTAIRDIADGDYIAGSVRMLDAMLVSLCIVAGVMLVYTLYHRLTGGFL